MSNGAKRNKKIGTIRWAIVLAFIVTFFSVVSYLLTMAIRFYYYGHAGDNVFAWSVAIYQIMGSSDCGNFSYAVPQDGKTFKWNGRCGKRKVRCGDSHRKFW